MKKRMLKFLGVFFTVSVLLTLFLFSASAKTVVSGDFKFDVGSKYATLVKYTGKAKTVKIPSKVKGVTVTKIGEYAFSEKTSMTSVTIPSGVKAIEEGAFDNCKSLTKIVIPSKVKTIGSGAFWYCAKLKTVVIPKSVTSIGKNAFKGCPKNMTVYVTKGSFAEKHVKTLKNVNLGYRYATSLKLSNTSLELTVGSTDTLKVTLNPKVLYNSKVKFTSSDSKIVKVSSAGKLTAVACGDAVITVAALDGSGKKATCKVSVSPAKISSFKQSEKGKTTVTLKWTASKGAYGYDVYKYDSVNKKWVKLGNTTKLEYTAKNLSLASSVKFRVRGYKKVDSKYRYSSYAYLTAATLVPENVTGLKATEIKTDSAVLSWNKAANADGYKIYGYDSEKNKYTELAATKDTSYVLSKLASNSVYTYAVKSYISDSKKTAECKKYSDKLEIVTPPEKVTGLDTAGKFADYNSIVIEWAPVEGADGYEVDLFDNEIEIFNIVAVLPENVTTYTFDNLDMGTQYTFKVRAFTNRGDKRIYGAYSEVLIAETLGLPEDEAAAVKSFCEALYATKTYTGSCTIYETTTCYAVTNPLEGFEDTVKSLVSTNPKVYNIKDNKVVGKEMTISEVITASDDTLLYENILEDSISFAKNGAGFEISFVLKPETQEAVSASAVTKPIGWKEVAEKNTDFLLDGCTYSGTRITAKVQSGKISYIFADMPFEAQFTLAGAQASMNGEIGKKIIITYGD